MNFNDVIGLKLTWQDPAAILHALTRDAMRYADGLEGWTTTCGIVLQATPLREIEVGLTPNCMGCLGGTVELPDCQRCNDTGYMSNGWPDFPCHCPAGDVAPFNVVDDNNEVRRTTIGAELKEIMGTWRRQ